MLAGFGRYTEVNGEMLTSELTEIQYPVKQIEFVGLK